MDSDQETARKALCSLDPSRAEDRDDWLRVGMALHSVSQDLLHDWDQWSKISEKYQRAECVRQWRSFKPNGGVGLGSLLHWAQHDSGKEPNSQVKGELTQSTSGHETLDAAIRDQAKRLNASATEKWPYSGSSLVVVRFDLREVQHGSREKQFRPFHSRDGRWHLGDPTGLLPLYHRDELADEDTVFVCEGEKAADAAASLGLVATTSAHGAQAPHKTDWAPLAGKEIVILPDRDPPGMKYAESVAQIVLGLTRPATPKIVALPGLPKHGDIVEFIESRMRAGKDHDDIRKEIQELASQVEPFVSSGSTRAQDCERWPEPRPLPDPLPPVQPFECSLLPRALRPWIEDITDRMQCPPDFCATTAMVALASLVGRKIGIRPKAEDDWLVVPNLWAGSIGRPGILKTPALQEVLRPLHHLETKAKDAYEEARLKSDAANMVQKQGQRVAEEQIRKALKNGGDPNSVAHRYLSQTQEPPARRRYILNDCTVEACGAVLHENPNGVLIYRDELVGLLRSLDKEGQQGARPFYLEAWNGTGRYTYDRIGRGTIDIEAAIVSITGGIQPGPLQAYLQAAVKGGAADDGLVQRFQLMVWPEISKEWVNVDRIPDRIAREQATEVFRRLDQLCPDEVRAEVEEHGIPFLRFSAEAQVEFDGWRAGLEGQLRTGDEHPAMEAHLAKYRSLIPSLALLIHLADDGRGPVGIEPLRTALAWSPYLESHARRVYSVAVGVEAYAANALAKRLQKKAMADGFTHRDLYRKAWAGLAKDEAKLALEALVELQWLRATVVDTGGRKSTRYSINPRIHDSPDVGTTKMTRVRSDPFGSCDSAPSAEVSN